MRKISLLVAFALLLASCSSGSNAEVASLEDPTEATTASSDEADVDAEQAVLEFAQCMRDNGVEDFPDPELDSNGNLQLFGAGGPGGLGVDQDTLRAAFEECGDIVEGLFQRNFENIDQSELQDSFLEFASCMRDHGIDMPDPDFSGGFGPGAGGPGGLFGDIDPDDPAFQEAAEACSDVFEGGFGPGGGGPLGDPGQGGGSGDDA